VLVTAAGSGVGGAAIALARFAGARVLATASTEAKRRRALQAGVEHAIDYTQTGWASEVRDLTGGRGIDLVVDHVGESAFPEAVRALASKGRIVICGAFGAHAEIDLIDLFAPQISVIGSSDGTRRELLEVLRLLGEGRIGSAGDRDGASARAGRRGARAPLQPRPLRHGPPRSSKLTRAPSSQYAIQPPSTSRFVPLMYEQSSEARKTAAVATSSGWPRRKNGVRVRE
jgi:NADPH:quinone reductase-like Zn-dependent oxidoreductase